MKKVQIKSKRVRHFFPWVYKNEIENLDGFEPGEVVAIYEKERFIGVGYINPNSTIAVRILSFKNRAIDRDFFASKIDEAFQKRLDIPSNAYRLVHSEADSLPGLVVDRYEEYLSVQILTAGMANFQEEIVEILLKKFAPKGIYIQAPESLMQKEGLRGYTHVVGNIPQRIVISENGVKFAIDLLNAQKTGFYLDQRKNRKIVSDYLRQKSRVLDCFSNTGGFALYAALCKNAESILVDISATAIEQAKHNFSLNGVNATFVQANVFDYLRELRKQKAKFDLVVLDPPSFAKSKGHKAGALKGFKDITVNGMKLVDNGGLLALFSCSHHVDMEDLKKILLKASMDNKKRIEIVEHLYQDIDHPYLLNDEFSLYLKGLLCRIDEP